MNKKIIRGISIFLLTVMLMTSLTSCGTLIDFIEATKILKLHFADESERPAIFYDIVDQSIFRMDSFTSENKIKIATKYGNIYTTATIKMGETDEGMFYQTRSEMVYDGTKTIEEEGYIYGNAYRVFQNDNQITKLYSECSEEEYIAHISGGEEDSTDGIVENSRVKTCQKNSDGTYVATYSDFSENGLKLFANNLRNIEDMFENDYVLSGVEVEIKADDNLLPISYTYVYHFKIKGTGKSVSVPKIESVVLFSDINQTEANPINISSYEKVDDVLIIQTVSEELNAMINQKDSNKFTMHLQQTAKSSSEQYETKYEETHTVSYIRLNGKIQYQDEIFENNLNRTLRRYEGGEWDLIDISTRRMIDSGDSTDEAEFAYVQSLMIPMGFPEENICNVTKLDDGRYEFDVSGTNKAIYEEIAKNLEMSSMEYSEVILITFDNDTIKSYEYRINVVMKHGSESFTIVQTITCTYE